MDTPHRRDHVKGFKVQVTFSPETRKEIYKAQNGYCARSGCLHEIHSIHHKLSNNKANRKKYPLYIHSPLNGIGLCEGHHRNNAHEFRVTGQEAELYESFLNAISQEVKP